MGLPIVGDGVVVDRLVASDAAALSRSHSDPDNARFQGWQSPLSEEEALAFIAEQQDAEPLAPGTGVQLAIRERTEGPLAGDLYLHRGAEPGAPAEIGITLVPGFGGRGLATRTIAAVVDAVAGPCVARIDVGNVRSRALFERSGFRQVEEVDGEVRYERSGSAKGNAG